MKKYLVVFLIFIMYGLNLHANALTSSFDKLSHLIFKAAWPTARYVDYDILEVDKDEKFIVVKMNGISAFSDGKLYLHLKILFNDNYGIKDVKVIKHNAILSPPFHTLGALSELIENSNRASNGGYYISVKNNCYKTIKIAINYKPVYGGWTSEYWWEFEPYSEAYLTENHSKLTTKNSVIYYYAVSKDEKYEWSGSNYSTYINGEKINMKKLTDNEGDTDIVLNCS